MIPGDTDQNQLQQFLHETIGFSKKDAKNVAIALDISWLKLPSQHNHTIAYKLRFLKEEFTVRILNFLTDKYKNRGPDGQALGDNVVSKFKVQMDMKKYLQANMMFQPHEAYVVSMALKMPYDQLVSTPDVVISNLLQHLPYRYTSQVLKWIHQCYPNRGRDAKGLVREDFYIDPETLRAL